MKTNITFIICVAISVLGWSQKKENLGEYFHLQGQLLAIDPFSDEEGKTGQTQVVVMQDEEIFVAFDSKMTGKYEFYLPIGHIYTIAFGGKQFVNKKVMIDATKTPKEKKPRSMKLDIGLFPPIEGASFATLDEPFVKITYNKEYDDFVPDFDHTESMMKKLDKELKVARKSRNKSSKPSASSPEEGRKDR
jgi:hypothetical protein